MDTFYTILYFVLFPAPAVAFAVYVFYKITKGR